MTTTNIMSDEMRFSLRIREKGSQEEPFYKQDGGRFELADATVKLKVGIEYVISIKVDPAQRIRDNTLVVRHEDLDASDRAPQGEGETDDDKATSLELSKDPYHHNFLAAAWKNTLLPCKKTERRTVWLVLTFDDDGSKLEIAMQAKVYRPGSSGLRNGTPLKMIQHTLAPSMLDKGAYTLRSRKYIG